MGTGVTALMILQSLESTVEVVSDFRHGEVGSPHVRGGEDHRRRHPLNLPTDQGLRFDHHDLSSSVVAGALTGTATESEALAALSGLVGTAALRDIVLCHVIPGKAVSYSEAFATKPSKAKEIKMANGDYLTIRNYRIIDGTDNRVWPKMGSVDIKADNGVIHVVKEVLSPPSDT